MFDPREETIEKIKWNDEGIVEIQAGGWHWQGAKRKDFWCPDDPWEMIIKVGSRIRLWTIQFSMIIGFELWSDEKQKWIPVWCCINDFQTEAERKKSADAYTNFMLEEGKKIAIAIDEGKSLEEIDKEVISDGHSGNTHACALSYGISHAKNKENADAVRKAHNKFWGVEESKGLVNPAVVTIEG